MLTYVGYVFTALGPKERERKVELCNKRHLTYYRVIDQHIALLRMIPEEAGSSHRDRYFGDKVGLRCRMNSISKLAAFFICQK
jgi:hypothetical protein